MLAELHTERFVDAAPAAVYATLLDEGRYLASRAHDVPHPGRQRRGPRAARSAPPSRLCPARAPGHGHRTSSGAGISRSSGVRPSGRYFYLYVLLDVFSRYVPGWLVATRESAALAERLIADSGPPSRASRRASSPIHADRGSSMTSRPVALLLADLGIAKSHSRPHVSNDNPYSRSPVQDPQVPADLPRPLRLARGRPRLLPARSSPGTTKQHRHAGIGLLTPGRCPLRAGPRRPGRPGRRPRRRLRRPPRALRPPAAHAARTPHRGLDQPAEREGGATSVVLREASHWA